MKTVLIILVLCGLIFLAQFIFPWYILVVIASCFGFLSANSWKNAFFIPFFAVFLIWSVYPLIISTQDGFKMATIIGQVFGGLPSFAILIINGLVFGFIGGLGGLSAYLVKKSGAKSM